MVFLNGVSMETPQKNTTEYRIHGLIFFHFIRWAKIVRGVQNPLASENTGTVKSEKMSAFRQNSNFVTGARIAVDYVPKVTFFQEWWIITNFILWK